jgi:segregation and condensation protein A
VELKDRRASRALPQVALQEMLIAFKDVVARSAMFAHHQIQRERLSVGERMSDILAQLEGVPGFVPFLQLFRPEEGRMGVTITFAAILELMRETLIEVVQAQAYGPLHVRAASSAPTLRVVSEAAAPADEDPR